MRCQLKGLPLAGRKLTWWEKAWSRVRKWIHYVKLGVHKVWNNPRLLIRKIRRIIGLPEREDRPSASDSARHVLGVQPGDYVRVKSSAGIRATLDDHSCYEGLGYMGAIMDRYCGGVYQVLKRVDRFFDERTQRMLKLKNTVILDRVYCEPEPDGEERIAGCNRMCFLFWKEAWLERLDSDATPTERANHSNG